MVWIYYQYGIRLISISNSNDRANPDPFLLYLASSVTNRLHLSDGLLS